jgi:hypothetical protein
MALDSKARELDGVLNFALEAHRLSRNPPLMQSSVPKEKKYHSEGKVKDISQRMRAVEGVRRGCLGSD